MQRRFWRCRGYWRPQESNLKQATRAAMTRRGKFVRGRASMRAEAVRIELTTLGKCLPEGTPNCASAWIFKLYQGNGAGRIQMDSPFVFSEVSPSCASIRRPAVALVQGEGLEPPLSRSKRGVLPLDDP